MPTKRQRRTRQTRQGYDFGERTAKPWEFGAIFGPDHYSGGLESNLTVVEDELWVLMYQNAYSDPNPLSEPLTKELLARYEAVFGPVKDLIVSGYLAGQLTTEQIEQIWQKRDGADSS